MQLLCHRIIQLETLSLMGLKRWPSWKKRDFSNNFDAYDKFEDSPKLSVFVPPLKEEEIIPMWYHVEKGSFHINKLTRRCAFSFHLIYQWFHHDPFSYFLVWVGNEYHWWSKYKIFARFSWSIFVCVKFLKGMWEDKN